MIAIKQLKEKILKVLEQFPVSRNSDQWLTIKLWCLYQPTHIHQDDKGKKYVYLTDVMELVREDNVKRIRAHIQNEEYKFLPTNIKIAKQRKINEETWKEYFRTHPYEKSN